MVTISNLNDDEYDQLAAQGTFVVGSYSDEGTALTPGKAFGSSKHIQEINERLSLTTPAKELPVESKKKKAKKVEEDEYPAGSLFRPRIKTIVFNTQIGKIRLNTVGILNCPQAICLIVDKDELKYEPAVGYKCEMIIGEETFSVAYFGFKFDWPDSNNVLMIFVVNQEDEHEQSDQS